MTDPVRVMFGVGMADIGFDVQIDMIKVIVPADKILVSPGVHVTVSGNPDPVQSEILIGFESTVHYHIGIFAVGSRIQNVAFSVFTAG